MHSGQFTLVEPYDTWLFRAWLLSRSIVRSRVPRAVAGVGAASSVDVPPWGHTTLVCSSVRRWTLDRLHLLGPVARAGTNIYSQEFQYPFSILLRIR